MPATDVFFDTWAWWEYLGGTKAGRQLSRAYVSNPRIRVHSSILTLAEIAAKLASRGQARLTRSTLARVEGRSTVHTIPREVIESSGLLRQELRKADTDASIIDALILATARSLNAPLISGDAAFGRQPDARAR